MPTNQPKSVAEVIIEQLHMWGVQRIYGVTGSAIFGLMDALAKQDRISFIATKHESAAAMMAAAEAKITGKLGVCVSQMGPGLANLINGLGDAYMDKAPVLAISGQASLDKIGTYYKQFVNQQQMVQAISSYSELVVHPESISEQLTKAMQTALLERTVAHLSIPSELFFALTSNDARMPVPFKMPEADSEQLLQALDMMQNAKRPLIYAGGKVRSYRDGLQALAETWGAGIALNYGAVGAVPDQHPFNLHGLGEGGNPLLPEFTRQADVVLAVQSAWWPQQLMSKNARVIQIAEHSASIGLPIPADALLVGDPANTVRKLRDGLDRVKPNRSWLQQIMTCKQQWNELNEQERKQTAEPMHPAHIIKTVEETIEDDAIIALDEGDSTVWFLRNFRSRNEQVVLSSRWRTMGFGLPAAIAAKLCAPKRQVVCITGDGGLAMVLADLSTAVRYELPITVIVFNNGALQMERDKMRQQGLLWKGTDLTNPDFAGVAAACGWDAHRIHRNEQLAEVLKNAQRNRKPMLLDIETAPVQHPDFITHSTEKELVRQ